MKTFAAFLRDERGSAVMEFCLWLPLFMFFLAAIIDASVLYLTHTEMWNVARDTARRVTTGQLDKNNTAQIVTHVRDELTVGGRQYFVEPIYDSTSNSISIRVGTMIWDASVFGIFGMFAGQHDILRRTLESTVVMQMEPN